MFSSSQTSTHIVILLLLSSSSFFLYVLLNPNLHPHCHSLPTHILPFFLGCLLSFQLEFDEPKCKSSFYSYFPALPAPSPFLTKFIKRWLHDYSSYKNIRKYILIGFQGSKHISQMPGICCFEYVSCLESNDTVMITGLKLGQFLDGTSSYGSTFGIYTKLKVFLF